MTLIVMALFWLCAFFRPANSQEVQEYQVKAVFLYNLTHFVYWPDSKRSSDTPFTIGIYGKDPFGEFLDRTISNEMKSGQPLQIRRLNKPEQFTEECCQILFISKSGMDDWEQLRERVADRPVLTVADFEDFTSVGGMVSLLKNAKKIQVEINLNRVKQSGLGMSAKLLRLARIVE